MLRIRWFWEVFRISRAHWSGMLSCAILLVIVSLSTKYWLIYMLFVPSVLWHCWLGGRKGTQPVKNWVVGCWRGYLSGARCRLAYGPADATATHSVSCFSKIQIGFACLVPAHPGSPGQRAVKLVCVTGWAKKVRHKLMAVILCHILTDFQFFHWKISWFTSLLLLLLLLVLLLLLLYN